MICTNCQNNIPEDSRFCVHCGHPVKVQEPSQQPVFSVSQPKKNKTGLIAGMTAGCLALISLLFAGLFLIKQLSAKNYDLTEYIAISYEGLDGEGTAIVTLDEKNLMEDVVEMLDSDYSKNETMRMIKKAITLEADRREGLSDGDEITIRAEVDQSLLKGLHIRITINDITDEVHGLTHLTAFDPFDGLLLTFDGSDGLATLNIKRGFGYGDLYLLVEGGTQILSQYDGQVSVFSNGDEVTVTLSAAPDRFVDPTEVCKQHLVYPVSIKMTETVHDLPAPSLFDPFSEYAFTVSGVSGFASISSDYYAWFPNHYYSFSYSKSENLANGDTITITLDAIEDAYSSIPVDLNNPYDLYYHVFDRELPESYTMELTISDLAVGSLEEMTPEQLQTLIAGREAYFNSEIDKGTPSDLSYEGAYMCVSKSDYTWDDNRIYFLFTYQSEGSTVYYVAGLSDVVLSSDGNFHYDVIRSYNFKYQYALPYCTEYGSYVSQEAFYDDVISGLTDYNITFSEAQ